MSPSKLGTSIAVIVAASTVSLTAFAQDPGVATSVPVTTAGYDLSNTGFDSSEIADIEERGEVYYPTALDNGPYPFVLFLHGRHVTCYNTTTPANTFYKWPCGAGEAPIPSYQGYAEVGRILASHGFIVVSISANGINGRDNDLPTFTGGQASRGELVQHHLDIWAGYNSVGGAPFGTTFVNQIDLSNVGTMGHSRGGEGVVFNYLLNRDLGSPYGIRAVFPLAPTDFHRKVVHGAPVGILLPYCDGDLSENQGAGYFDDARYDDPSDPASKFYFLVMGTNHNFYNTIWTPGGFTAGTSDDADGHYGAADATCGSNNTPPRLDAAQQRRVENAYLAGFFRYYLKGEAEFLPQLRGDTPPPPSTAPAVLHNTLHPPALQRLDVNRTLTNAELDQNALNGTVTDIGLTPYERCGGAGPRCTTLSLSRSPHEQDFPVNMLRFGWNATTASWDNAIPAVQKDLSRFDTLQFRAAINRDDNRNPANTEQAFSVVLTDGSGASADVSTADFGDGLFFPPGQGEAESMVLSSVRVPLSAFSGAVDLTDVTNITFGFDQQSAGGLFVTDVGVSSTVNQAASDIVMVLDRSGSMSAQDFSGNPETRLETAVKAARFFAAALDPDLGHRVAIVSYNQVAEQRLGFVDVDATFDPNSGPFSAALDQLLTDGPSGSTSIGDGVQEALTLLPNFATTGRRPAMLLLTDGRQNTAPCIAVGNGSGGWNTGDCNAGGVDANLVKETDPRLRDAAVCSIGMARAAGQVDETILEDFSTRYLAAQSNVGDYNATMTAFSKCAPELGPGGIAVDPAGLLPRELVTAPPVGYDSCADRKITFVSSWHRTVDAPGDMRLIVTDPNGDLLQATGVGEGSLSSDWDIQRVQRPTAGSWRFQVMRHHTRIVNGFTTDSFVNPANGAALVKRQIERLCPDGCNQVLYFEDGRASSSSRSAYADALTALGPSGTGLLGTVTSFDESDAAAFTAALGMSGYDLVVYAHQLDFTSESAEPYDAALRNVLCTTTVPAIVTDTRAPTFVATTDPALFHTCSGALVSSEHSNYSALVDPDGDATMIDATLPLTNRGYATFSYSIAATPFDRIANHFENSNLAVGATQLEGGTNETFLADAVSEALPVPFGSIVTFSADRPYTIPDIVVGLENEPPVLEAGSTKTRFDEQWSSAVRFEGASPAVPRVEFDPDSGELHVGLILDGGRSVDAANGASAWVEVVRPTVDLASVFGSFGCTGSTMPNGDIVFGNGLSVAPEDIPVVREVHGLNDEGRRGDETAADGVLSASFLAPIQGTYEISYFVDLGESQNGASCEAHREARVTLHVGDEVIGSGAPCTPQNPNGGFGPKGTILSDDPADCPAGTNVIVGTSAGETLIGTPGSDCILGLGGNDFIDGRGGNDFISGGSGNDRLYGGSGDDVVFGESGDDIVTGSHGDDVLYGGPGNDRIDAGSGDDIVYGNDGKDTIDAGEGKDIVLSGRGRDKLVGEGGDDTLHGGADSDECEGGLGSNDCIACEREKQCNEAVRPPKPHHPHHPRPNHHPPHWPHY